MTPDQITARNEIGGLGVLGDTMADDNLAIALASYFESRLDCPDDDHDDDTGWSQWAIDRTNDLLDRIVTSVEQMMEASDDS